jgi:dsRNA-specific ribonuclease
MHAKTVASSGKHAKTVSSSGKHAKTAVPSGKHVDETAFSSEMHAKTAVPPEMHAKTAVPSEMHAKTAVPPEMHAKTAVPSEMHAKTAVPPEMHGPDDRSFKLLIIKLLSGHLPVPDLESIAQNADVVALFRRAFTHRYSSVDNNLEVLEFLGDSRCRAALATWLVKKFPTETREAVFSEITSHFLSKTKLTEYSIELGLPSYIIKPEGIPKTDDDKEDIFEAVMGAIFIACEDFIMNGTGDFVLESILSPIFEKQGINPEKRREYIDAVSLLKRGVNTFFKGRDPSYKIQEKMTSDPNFVYRTIMLYEARVTIPIGIEKGGEEAMDMDAGRSPGAGRGNGDLPYPSGQRGGWRGDRSRGGRGRGRGGMRNVPFSRPERYLMKTFELLPEQAQRSKQKAKELVSKIAIQYMRWDFDVIEAERRRRDEQATFRFLELLGDRLTKIRGILGGEGVVSKKEQWHSLQKRLLSLYPRKETEISLLSPRNTYSFSVAYKKELADVEVMLAIKTRESGSFTTIENVISKPGAVASAYKRLVLAYTARIAVAFSIDPAVLESVRMRDQSKNHPTHRAT